MLHTPFYNPGRTYKENYDEGPFGEFANYKIYTQKGDPKYDYLGEKVYLPFGIPAGPLLNGKFCKAALDKGFDIVVYKTVRTHKYVSHKWPNVLSLSITSNLTEDIAENGIVGHHDFSGPLSITNSFGVPSFDPNIWQPDLADVVKYAKNGQVVVGSFQGTVNVDHNHKKYVADFVLAAKLMRETGVKVMEINLSCPNEGHGNFLCFDVKRTKEIAYKVKSAIGDTPLVLKIAYFHDDEKLKEFVQELGEIVQGIAAINTLTAKIVDENGRQALPGEGREKSGVCGLAIKWAGLEMVERLKKHREQFRYNFSVEGVGGVMNGKDYFEYIKAGADSVMSATGAMWNPFLAQEIKKLN